MSNSVQPSVNFTSQDYFESQSNIPTLNVSAPLTWDEPNANLGITPATSNSSGIVTTAAQTFQGKKNFLVAPTSVLPSAASDIATKAYVDSISVKMHWERPIDRFHNFETGLPVGLSNGKRYVSTNEYDGFKLHWIWEYTASTETFHGFQPVEGTTVRVLEDSSLHGNQIMTFNGTDWVSVATGVLHDSLIGVPDDSYTHADINEHIDDPEAHAGQDLSIDAHPTFNALSIENQEESVDLVVNSIQAAVSTSADRLVLSTAGNSIVLDSTDTINTVSVTGDTYIKNTSQGGTSTLLRLTSPDNKAYDVTASSQMSVSTPSKVGALLMSEAGETSVHRLKMIDTAPVISDIKSDVVASSLNNSTLLTEQAAVRYNDNSNRILGFVNRSHSKISISGATFTIEPASGYSSFSYYCEDPTDGIIKMYTKTEAENISITLGGLVFYYGSTLQLSNTFNPEIIKRYAFVAYVNRYASVNNIFADERHTIAMHALTHYNLHNTIGARLLRGGTIDLTLNNTSQTGISISSGVLLDEDLEHNVAVKETTDIMRVLRFVGSDEGGIGITYHESIGPFVLSGTNLQRNALVGGEWVLSAIDNNRYVLGHVLATNALTQDDSILGETRFMGLLGQTQYNTANAAREGALSEVKNMYLVGLPLPEFQFVGTVIYQQDGTSIKLVAVDGSGSKYIDWRDKTINATGVTPSSHGALSGLLNDDHPQYALVTGRDNETLSAHAISSGVSRSNRHDSKWKKVTVTADTQLLLTDPAKIYVDVNYHLFILPVHTAADEGITFEILCSNNVISCGFMVNNGSTTKPLPFNGEDPLIYANQRIKIELVDSAYDDGYGLWSIMYIPTYTMMNQHFSYIGNADRDITETSFTILYAACKLDLPAGKWLITLESAVYVAGSNSSGNLALARMTGESTFDVIPRTYMGYYSNSAAGMTFQYCTSTIETTTTTSTVYTFVGLRNGSSTVNIPNSGNVRLRFDAIRLR